MPSPAPKLDLNLGYWGIGPAGTDAVEYVQEAERLGYDAIWAAESYGSDVVSVLAYMAAKTERVKLGCSIMQVPARPPAAAAMAGVTIDELSGGRFIFGFGPSGPQVSEGWYGVPYAKAWGRTREYVEVVRKIVAREGYLDHQGRHYQLPLREGEGVTGQGKPLKLNFHPRRTEIPVFIGAIGRKSVELAAEVSDGWIPIFFSVDGFEDAWGEHIAAGLANSGRGRESFQIAPSLQVAIDGDLETARNMVKMGLLLYLGGMGSRKTNFYVDLACRFGFEEPALEVQRLFQDGRKEEAFAALPDELVDATALIGTEDEVAERVRRFSEVGIDRILVSPVHGDKEERLHTMERMASITGVAAAPA